MDFPLGNSSFPSFLRACLPACLPSCFPALLRTFLPPSFPSLSPFPHSFLFLVCSAETFLNGRRLLCVLRCYRSHFHAAAGVRSAGHSWAGGWLPCPPPPATSSRGGSAASRPRQPLASAPESSQDSLFETRPKLMFLQLSFGVLKPAREPSFPPVKLRQILQCKIRHL